MPSPEEMAVNFIISMVASLFAVMIVLAIERSRKPKLRFAIERDHPPVLDGRRFLRLHVYNEPISPLLGIFVPRSPALMCRASLMFLHEDNQPVFSRGQRMVGRWSRTPEPVLPFTIDPKTKQVLLLRDPTRTRDEVDISPGRDSYEILDVVVRAPGSDSCQGWHNGIIQHPDPRPTEVFELLKGRFRVIVTVTTGGEEFSRVFRIVNDVGLEHFRLEDIEQQPKVARDL